MKGSAPGYVGGRSFVAGQYDVVMAPAGIHHGADRDVPADMASAMIGFGSPPQLDLYLESGFYADRSYAQPPFDRYDWTL